jgi:hypothetical protein
MPEASRQTKGNLPVSIATEKRKILKPKRCAILEG